ncbi:MAG TPA: hypothetical protein VIF64_19105 [Pyrinomonadaceae bacterium]|jgi:hypothetical protein
MMRLLAAALIVAGAVIGAMVECVVPEKLIAQESQPQTAEGSPDLPTREERIKRLGSYRAKGGQDLALPEAPDSQGLAKETQERFQETLRAYYDYRRSGYDHRRSVFEWQLISSRIIFVVVLILVFAGIYFAAIQFHYGLRPRGTRKEEERTEATEFVFSLKEFKVRSPVLGVIVLTLSLGFFYLYLVYVYPIENVF